MYKGTSTVLLSSHVCKRMLHNFSERPVRELTETLTIMIPMPYVMLRQFMVPTDMRLGVTPYQNAHGYPPIAGALACDLEIAAPVHILHLEDDQVTIAPYAEIDKANISLWYGYAEVYSYEGRMVSAKDFTLPEEEFYFDKDTFNKPPDGFAIIDVPLEQCVPCTSYGCPLTHQCAECWESPLHIMTSFVNLLRSEEVFVRKELHGLLQADLETLHKGKDWKLRSIPTVLASENCDVEYLGVHTGLKRIATSLCE